MYAITKYIKYQVKSSVNPPIAHQFVIKEQVLIENIPYLQS